MKDFEFKNLHVGDMVLVRNGDTGTVTSITENGFKSKIFISSGVYYHCMHFKNGKSYNSVSSEDGCDSCDVMQIY